MPSLLQPPAPKRTASKPLDFGFYPSTWNCISIHFSIWICVCVCIWICPLFYCHVPAPIWNDSKALMIVFRISSLDCVLGVVFFCLLRDRIMNMVDTQRVSLYQSLQIPIILSTWNRQLEVALVLVLQVCMLWLFCLTLSRIFTAHMADILRQFWWLHISTKAVFPTAISNINQIERILTL